jgi:tRNA pseudouridine55 synthase
MTLDGLLIVDKPEGPTSHDIVDEIRRLAGIRRVGHAGTLDPFATGLLPLCLGRATRLSRFVTSSRKVYEAVMRLGMVTDTYDRTGRPLREASVQDVGRERVTAAARRFVGDILQVPPPFSARKHQGRRLHERARAGEMVLLSPSPVTIFRLEILEVSGPFVRFVTETSPGTYIRSLAHDLGEALGCGAHLTALRRTACGGLSLEKARTLDDLRASAANGALADHLLSLHAIELGLPTVVLTDDGAAAMASGRTLTPAHVASFVEQQSLAGGSPVRVKDLQGRLLGVALAAVRGETFELQPDVVLSG